jgi:hypothetical protein
LPSSLPSRGAWLVWLSVLGGVCRSVLVMMATEFVNLLELPLTPSTEIIIGNIAHSESEHESKSLESSELVEKFSIFKDSVDTFAIPSSEFLNEVRKIICVDYRVVNMGSDIKFEDDPFNVQLFGIMDPLGFSTSMKRINSELERCRASNIDHALLTAGPALLPLIPWAIRQKRRKALRRQVMEKCVEHFNKEHPQLFMRWQTRPEKKLTIMTKASALYLMAE